MNKQYNQTITACFVGYIVQAIINNFVPLLFLTFERTYQIPLSQITLLVTINFGVQLLVDLLSIKFVDKIGYRASIVIAHLCSAAGLVLLTILPEVMDHAFLGILTAVIVYAVGGGLLEVLVSPIVEACPSDHKEKAMSMLHSFYCWGHVGVVAISTIYFYLVGISNWKLLAVIWAIIQCVCLCESSDRAAIAGRRVRDENAGSVPPENILGAVYYDDLCRSKRTGSQSVGLYFR